MNKTTEKAPTPAYASFKSLTTFADAIRELNHVPAVIDRSAMRTFSGATQNELMVALRFLGLIGDNAVPTQRFSDYALADDESRKKILAEILRDSYTFIFNNPKFNIERATENQTAELFREQNVNGSTNSRAIAFFLAAAKEAGIKVSPHVKAPTIQRNGSTKPKKTKSVPPLAATDNGNKDNGSNHIPPGTHQFEIPLPLKGAVRVIVPNDIDGEDWELINTMFAAYMKRWKGFMAAQQAATKSKQEESE